MRHTASSRFIAHRPATGRFGVCASLCLWCCLLLLPGWAAPPAKPTPPAKLDIFTAVEHGNLAAVRSLLKAHPELVKAKDAFHQTALFLAAYHGNVEIVKLLLAKGAEINPKNADYPLDGAIAANKPELVKLLLAKGAKVTGDARPLDAAAMVGNLDIVKMLVAQGAEPWLRGDSCVIRVDEEGKVTSTTVHGTGDLPIHLAALSGHTELVDYFITLGIDVNAKGNSGVTPLHLAAGKGHLETVQFLLTKGADVFARDDNDQDTQQAAVAGRNLAVSLRKGYAELPPALQKEATLPEPDANFEQIIVLINDLMGKLTLHKHVPGAK